MKRLLEERTIMCRERGIPYVPIFLDGGFATQCERVGINLDHPLWSTRAVIEDLPQVVRVHAAFFAAGADAVSTATYQCSTGGAEANGTTMNAVAEAAVAAAREAAGASPGRMVWGSLSPIGATLGGGAEYTGAYEFDTDALRAFHRPRVQALLDMNVDVLLLETFPRLDEALAALSAVAELYASNNSEYLPPVCVSFTQKPNSAVPVTGSGDSMMLEAVKKVADFRFVRWIGVNCCTPGAATRYLQLWAENDALADVWLGSDGPTHPWSWVQRGVAVYPNSGVRWMEDPEAPGTGRWDATHLPEAEAVIGRRLVAHWPAWESALTTLGTKHLISVVLGGCCRTYPEDIASLKAAALPT